MAVTTSEIIARKSSVTAAVSVLGHSSQQISGLAITVLAAGVLGPADYGVYALALVFVEVVVLFLYSGFYNYAVAAREEDDVLISTLFWVFLTIGALGGLALFALAAPFASAFDAPDLAPVMRALAGVQPVSAVIAWAFAAMMRAGRMRRYYGVQIAMNLGGLAVGTLALVLWPSVFALVIYQAARAVIGAALLVVHGPGWRGARCDLSVVRRGVRFALGLYGARGLGFVANFGADVLLALFFSTAESGLYRFANRVASGAVDLIAQPLRSFALRAFGLAARRDAPLTPLFAAYVAGTIVLTGGVAVAVVILGGPLIGALFRPEYLLAVGAVQALSVRAVARVGQAMVEPVCSATGRTAVAFWLTLGLTGATLLVIFATAPYGLTALAWGQAILQLVSVPVTLWVVARWSPVDVRPTLRLGLRAGVVLGGYGGALWLCWRGVASLADGTGAVAIGVLTALVLGGVAGWAAKRLGLIDPVLFRD